jgi:hypothetical protein
MVKCMDVSVGMESPSELKLLILSLGSNSSLQVHLDFLRSNIIWRQFSTSSKHGRQYSILASKLYSESDTLVQILLSTFTRK